MNQPARTNRIVFAVLVIAFACCTACIPSCNMAVLKRERPQSETPEQKPPVQSAPATNGGAP